MDMAGLNHEALHTIDYEMKWLVDLDDFEKADFFCRHERLRCKPGVQLISDQKETVLFETAGR